MTARADGLADRARELFDDYRSGSAAAMSALVDQVTPLLWHVARGQGLDAGTAEDVVQTTWLRLIEHADRMKNSQAVLKWLLTTTRREAWGVSRKSSRDLPSSHDDWSFERAIDSSDQPEAVVLRGEREDLVWRHFRALSERCKELLRVIALADKPDYSGIAQALGMPVGSIGPTRGRCLAKLRAGIESDPAWVVTS